MRRFISRSAASRSPSDRTSKNTYWPAGTKVTITVKDYGKAVSPGLYGQADAAIHFAIGRKQVTLRSDQQEHVLAGRHEGHHHGEGLWQGREPRPLRAGGCGDSFRDRPQAGHR